MNTISRRYTFSAAHRLEGHPRCSRLHGHNYVVTVSIIHEQSKDTGMVLDYGRMDELLKPVIDQYDHRYIASSDNMQRGDPYLETAGKQGHVIYPGIAFSTAECLSQRIAAECGTALRDEFPFYFTLIVDVQESEKSHASYELKVE